MKRSRSLVCAVAALVVVASLALVISGCKPQNKDIILATTTSTADTGLLDVLIPAFEKKTGFVVKTVAVGSGAALTMGKNGEADVLLVHAPSSETPLVDSGVAINRKLVMHNDFVIVGPASDPAKIKGETSAAAAFAKLAEYASLLGQQPTAVFVSRGDDSGTHKKEQEVWKAADLAVKGEDNKPLPWYQETGSGMAATLLVASEKGAYTLTDRGTYLAQKANLSLDILVEGDKVLLNIYHVMQVNPEKFEKVNGKGGKAFVDFMVSAETQKVIETFGVDNYGSPLFFPDAGKPEF
ncbi:MAG: substrate-binding domain-containing protein [Bacillota bacterium]